MATQVSLNDGAVASAGALALQTNGTTQAVSISTGQVATLAQNPILTSGTANGVAYLNGSKAVTSGSALVFDGTSLGVGGAPASKLDVSGTVRSTTQTAPTSGAGMELFYDTGGAVGYLLAYDRTGAVYKQMNLGASLYTFGIAGSTAMTLNASGNLGLGTTSVISGARMDIRGNNSNTLSNLGTQVLTVIDDTSYAQNVGGGIGFGFKYSSANEVIQRGAVIKAAKENATDGNYATALVFATAPNAANTTEKMRLDSSGNLLVGAGITSSINGTFCPIQALNNTANQVAYFRNSNANPSGTIVNYSGASPNNTGNEFVYCSDSTAQRASLRSNGGLANYSANNVNLSDRREKTNFSPAKSYLDVICAIPVQTFNYIDQNMEDDGGLTLGVVAQDVQAVAPEMVMENNWGTEEEPKMRLSIYQTDLQYALMKCIQEQQVLITQLTARITALESA
jgi:hypothetical protein